jgi:hypothetical protein
LYAKARKSIIVRPCCQVLAEDEDDEAASQPELLKLTERRRLVAS